MVDPFVVACMDAAATAVAVAVASVAADHTWVNPESFAVEFLFDMELVVFLFAVVCRP